MKELNKTFQNECAKCDDENMEQCCIKEVRETTQKMVRVFQLFERDQIKVSGFTTSQCYSLIELLKSDGLTMNELSERMNLNTSTMTRIVDKLVRDKYLVRERYQEDRRVVVVKLSEKGRKASLDLNERLNQYYEKIIENLPEGKVEEVLDSVSLLLNAFEKANPNCC
ncbi:winged helix-turn-helix transcriptional regulator [Clostridium sp. D2Q-11]|uniref:Winged helix-turn-helix transcriptional regulator n=1 Tax=Anaeromonas frigoriresistens TaxID=2683708 RepID=A0A942UWS9_9FIRM|nr:MarR family winged helix-turn-helix transcriptional regulator [Anaeromonas frigoriresistens]MBS4538990.1 winged helix-turn-helix transcriptional regulator [Anaeromonas frigoriresistens]